MSGETVRRIRTSAVGLAVVALACAAAAPGAAAKIVLRDGRAGTPVAVVKTAKCRVRGNGTGFYAFARSTDRRYTLKVFIEDSWKGTRRTYRARYGADDPEIVVYRRSDHERYDTSYRPPRAPVLPLGNGVAGHIGFRKGGTELGLSGSIPNSDYTKGILFFPGLLRCR